MLFVSQYVRDWKYMHKAAVKGGTVISCMKQPDRNTTSTVLKIFSMILSLILRMTKSQSSLFKFLFLFTLCVLKVM